MELYIGSEGSVDTSYIIARTYVSKEEKKEVELIDIADMKVGNTVQSFFDGISKSLNNAAFYRVYSGENFHVDYEVSYGSVNIKAPKIDLSSGCFLDDEIIESALIFACKKDKRMKQAFMFLKDGEYFVETGMYSNAILSFVFMTEFLVNCILRENHLLNSRDNFKDKFDKECEDMYKKSHAKTGNPSFAFKKFIYGLSKVELSFPPELIEPINNCYNLRNKLAHGYSILEAFKICNINYEDNEVDEYNILDCMLVIIENTINIYNWFSDFYEN